MLKNPKVLKRGLVCWSTRTYLYGCPSRKVTVKSVLRERRHPREVYVAVDIAGKTHSIWVPTQFLTLQKPRGSVNCTGR